MTGGERVGVIHSIHNGVIQFWGWGTYVGEEMPPSDVNVFGESVTLTHKTPKILLDSGEIVWGVQCIWGSVEDIEPRLSGREVVSYLPVRTIKVVHISKVALKRQNKQNLPSKVAGYTNAKESQYANTGWMRISGE